MCCNSPKQRADGVMLEKNLRKRTCRPKRRNSKPCQRHGMPWQMQHRLQKFVSQFFPVARERFHQAPISARIARELLCCKIDIPMQARRGTVIERMCQRNFALNPFEPESFERKRLEKRRPGSQRVNCGTNVVYKARQRELG